jgi:hypothetical protein
MLRATCREREDLGAAAPGRAGFRRSERCAHPSMLVVPPGSSTVLGLALIQELTYESADFAEASTGRTRSSSCTPLTTRPTANSDEGAQTSAIAGAAR